MAQRSQWNQRLEPHHPWPQTMAHVSSSHHPSGCTTFRRWSRLCHPHLPLRMGERFLRGSLCHTGVIHLLYPHTQSILTPSLYSHPLNTHTLSILTPALYSHPLNTHPLSILTPNQYSHPLNTHTQSILTPSLYSHPLRNDTLSITTSSHYYNTPDQQLLLTLTYHITSHHTIPYHTIPHHTTRFVEAETIAGEVMFVPRGWWHMVLNTDPSITIAVSHHFLSPAGLSNTLRMLRETPEEVDELTSSTHPLNPSITNTTRRR